MAGIMNQRVNLSLTISHELVSFGIELRSNRVAIKKCHKNVNFVTVL